MDSATGLALILATCGGERLESRERHRLHRRVLRGGRFRGEIDLPCGAALVVAVEHQQARADRLRAGLREAVADAAELEYSQCMI